MPYETEVVQTAVELKLKNGGWEYRREHWLPLYGRADFVAYHRNVKRRILIECKCDCKKIERAIMQVLCYRLQFKADPYIFVPMNAKTPVAEDLCREWGVTLVGIKVIDRNTWMYNKTLNRLLID